MDSTDLMPLPIPEGAKIKAQSKGTPFFCGGPRGASAAAPNRRPLVGRGARGAGALTLLGGRGPARGVGAARRTSPRCTTGPCRARRNGRALSAAAPPVPARTEGGAEEGGSSRAAPSRALGIPLAEGGAQTDPPRRRGVEGWGPGRVGPAGGPTSLSGASRREAGTLDRTGARLRTTALSSGRSKRLKASGTFRVDIGADASFCGRDPRGGLARCKGTLSSGVWSLGANKGNQGTSVEDTDTTSHDAAVTYLLSLFPFFSFRTDVFNEFQS